jgi:hypothetical protein
MQKVGTRDDKEKKMYERYTSRERYYEQQYHQSRNLNEVKFGTWKGTHNECPQVYPIITEQKPYIAGYSKATCSAANSNRGVSVGVDLEDGIWSYRKHCRIHSRCYRQIPRSITYEESLTQRELRALNGVTN